MGWVMLVLLGVTTAALLMVLRVPRLLWPLVGAMLMLGAAGYAWQGAPGLPGQPVSAEAVKLPVEPAYKDMRDALFGRFNGESLYFGISDRMLGDGDARAAAAVITGGIRYAPQNAALWSELGNVLALHDHAVSPASLFAFQQAMRLSPTHPGPPFFLGWTYIRSGQLAEARPYWARALALTPKGAFYRPAIADRLAALDSFLAGAPPPR